MRNTPGVPVGVEIDCLAVGSPVESLRVVLREKAPHAPEGE